MSARPETNGHELLELFLEKRPDPKSAISQWASFDLGVAGIMKYLKK